MPITSILRKSIVFLGAYLLFAVAAFAVNITGTVKNATTGKPSAGDNVDLLALQQGMSVLASTKTDSSGSFSFSVDDPNSPHLVRVTHDGVTYFPAGGPLRPGTTSTSIDVYDAGNRVSDVTTNVELVRMQGGGGILRLIQLVIIKNASSPPRALKGDKTYEMSLPEKAQIDQVFVQGPGGMAINTSATPEGKGQYSFNYALKPGETRFQVSYHLPYAGEVSLSPKINGNIQHFVVMMPQSMTFSPTDSDKFAPMNDKTSKVLVATNVNSSTDLSFKVSGTGMLSDDQQGGEQSQPRDKSRPAATDNRPGGGLGPPTDAPDPLHSYRWFVLAGLGVALLCGAVFMVNRSDQQNAETATLPAPVAPHVMVSQKVGAPIGFAVAPPQPLKNSTMLLDGLKDELYQLEVEKQQGSISDDEYQHAKSALDQILKRALARKPY